jgi:hypothetical protein
MIIYKIPKAEAKVIHEVQTFMKLGAKIKTKVHYF